LNCDETKELIHGYLDGELDLVKSLEIERHLNECRGCEGTHQGNLVLRSAIRENAPYFSAPRGLRKQIRKSLHEAHRVDSTPSRSVWNLGWLRPAAVFAAFALMAVLIWAVAARKTAPSTDDLLAQEIVSDHIRSLMVDHLTDVPSTDQHTVKPWFDGKLDFAPQVKDLSARGFSLIGGRLDYLNGRDVAVLVYQRRNHFINLYIWPADRMADAGISLATRQGYNLLHWTQGGMTYWAVSDLNNAELQEFAQLVQT
jgi:anti-sigma factor RsiW